MVVVVVQWLVVVVVVLMVGVLALVVDFREVIEISPSKLAHSGCQFGVSENLPLNKTTQQDVFSCNNLKVKMEHIILSLRDI